MALSCGINNKECFFCGVTLLFYCCWLSVEHMGCRAMVWLQGKERKRDALFC